MSDIDSLSIVPVEELTALRDMFSVEWPKYICGWNTIDTQYRNIKNIIDFPVKVCVPFGNKNNGVVVIWQLCAREMALEKKTQIATTSTNIYYIERSVAKNFEIQIPSDVTIKKPELEKASYINSVWPHRYPGSEEYIKKMIGWGFVSVMVGKDKEIMGWIITSVRGEQHSLYIREEYRRQGYGEFLIKWLGKQLADDNRQILAYIVVNNTSSEALYLKNQFKILCKGITLTCL